MNERTRNFYKSMRRVLAVIDAYPELRAYAAESKAVTLFAAAADAMEALERDHAATRRELRELAAVKRTLVEAINTTIASLAATAELLPPHPYALVSFSPLSDKLTTLEFTIGAGNIIDMTSRYADAFIDSGLHPMTFDIIRERLALLVAADCRAAYIEAHARSYNDRLEEVVGHARKRRKQLSSDLKAILTPESRAALHSAGSLGRTHRPKLLAAPAQPKLLAQPKSEEPAPAVSGIKRLVQRVGLRRLSS